MNCVRAWRCPSCSLFFQMLQPQLEADTRCQWPILWPWWAASGKQSPLDLRAGQRPLRDLDKILMVIARQAKASPRLLHYDAFSQSLFLNTPVLLSTRSVVKPSTNQNLFLKLRILAVGWETVDREVVMAMLVAPHSGVQTPSVKWVANLECLVRCAPRSNWD